MSEDLTTFQFDEKEWSMDREVIVSDLQLFSLMKRNGQWIGK